MILIFRKQMVAFLMAAGIMTGTASAQIQYGVKAGLNITELNTSSYQNSYINGAPETIRDFPRADFFGGAFVSIPLNSRFSVQPEAVFSGQGATGKSNGNVYSANQGYNFNYINIPVLLQYHLKNGIYVEAGPQLGILISAKVKQDIVGSAADQDLNAKSYLKPTDFAAAFGVGYISPVNLGFDVRYNLGLTNISNISQAQAATAPIQGGSIKNSVVQLGVFYIFGKPNKYAGKKTKSEF